MTTELGTELGTTLGTILSSMEIEGLPTFDTSKLYALDNLSTANYYVVATPATGGEQGIAGGGFGIVNIVQAPVAATRRVSLAGFNGGSGWSVDMTTAGWRTFAGMTSGSNIFVDVPSPAAGLLDVVFLDAGVSTLQATSMRGAGDKGATFTTPFRPGTAPGTDAHTLSATSNNGFAGGGRILAQLSYAGTPTLAQKQALSDAIRTLGDMPSKAAVEALMPGCTVRKRWSLKAALAAPNLPVTDGAAAPATLPETVAGAAADVFNRTGSPTIRVLDPASYPRTSYGALGFSGTNYFEAPSLSRTAATGSWFAVWATPWLITVNGQTYRTLLGFARGAILIVSGSTLQVQTGTSNLATYTLTSANVGSPMLICGTYDGTAGQAYVNGVSTGAAVTHAETGAASILRFGAEYTAAASWAGDWTLHGYAMGRTPGGISAAEALAHYNACVATGRIQPIAGKTEHIVDLTQDVVANGGPQNGVPATAQDRIGTDHLTRVGGLRVDTSGLTGFASTAGYLRSVGVGLQGSAGGFSGEALFIARTATGTHALCAHSHSATTGYAVYYTGTLAIAMSNGTTIVNHSLGAVNANALNHVAWVFNGTQLRTFVNGTLRTSNAQTAYAFTAGANNFYAGAQSTSQFPGLDAFVLREVGGSNTDVWSDAEVATAAASALSTGRLAGVPSKTQKQWSITQDTASGAVPALITDRVAGTDPLVVVNNKLEVAQRTERLWSYETTPISYGANGFATGVHLVTSAALTDVGGVPCFYTMVYRPDAQAGTNAVQILASQLVGSTVPGVQWYIASTGTQLGFSMAGAGGAGFVAVQTAIAATEVGKLDLVMGVYTGSALFLYRKRVQAGTTAAGFTAAAPSTALYVGSEAGGSPRVANGTSVMALGMGLGVPTLAQYQAWFDATQAADGLIQPVPGMTDQHRWVLGASGGVPATVTDQGSAPLSLTRAGTPTLASQYARTFTF